MPNFRSIPIDITDPEMAKVFAGLALYNDGMITIAYRQPIVISGIELDRLPLLAQPVGMGQRITLRVMQAPQSTQAKPRRSK